VAYRVLLVAILIQGLGALGGGAYLVADPSGVAIGLPISWLDDTPFSDYLVPGLILLSVLGVFPVVVAWGLWQERRWAWYGSLLVGAGLVIWILVEVLLIGYQPDPPLQAIYGLLGVLILGLTAARSVRARLTR